MRQEEGGELVSSGAKELPSTNAGVDDAGEVGDGGREVVVYDQLLAHLSGGHPGAAHHQRHPYVLLVGRLLVPPQPVVAEW